MRDDERYPTVVRQEDLPGLPEPAVPKPSDLINEHDKYPVHDDFEPGKDPQHGNTWVPSSDLATSPARNQRICGFKRRTWVIATVLLVLVVIGAVVGGVVGSTQSKAPSAPSVPSLPTPTGSLAAKDRFIAVSTTSTNSNDEDLQIFYQDLATNDILYRVMWAGSTKAEQRVALAIEPRQGTPLAVVASKGSPVVVSLFYIAADYAASEVFIVQATLSCGRGATACNTTTNQVVSTNVTSQVTINPMTALAAVKLTEGPSDIRVYYQTHWSHIWVLNGQNASTEGWSTQHVGGPTAPGTNVAAYQDGDGDLNVLCVFNVSMRLRLFDYVDVLGKEDPSKVVDESPGSGWLSTAKLAAAYVPARDSYRLYYVAPANGDIISYWRSGKLANWTASHIEDKQTWGAVESGLAAVAWRDQVRLLYFSDGRLAMSSQGNDTWAEMTYL